MMNQGDSKCRIRAKIAELANEIGRNAGQLRNNDLIPQSGILDSAGMMSLVVWFEDEFGVSTEAEDLTLDNFGSIDLIADFLARHSK